MRRVVVSLALLLTAPLFAQDYLKELPTVDELRQAVPGTDVLDSLAREAAALNQVRQMVAVQTGRADAFTLPSALTTGERQALESYAARLRTIFSTPGVDPNDLQVRAMRYDADATFVRALFDRFFSAEWMADYARAEARFQAAVREEESAGNDQTASNGGFVVYGPDGESITIGEIIANWIRTLLWIGVPAVAIILYFKLRTKTGGDIARNNQQELARLGASVEERSKRIEQLFNQRSETLTFKLRDKTKHNTVLQADIVRSLAAMPARERETLRAVYHLFNIGRINGKDFYYGRLTLIYGEGRAQALNPTAPSETLGDFTSAIKAHTGRTVESTVSLALSWVEKVARSDPGHPVVKALKEKLLGGGEASMSSAEAFVAAQGAGKRPALVLGTAEDSGAPVTYSGEGSVITIAPPRSGKTQCHVFPTLLTWMGPAVVLDIKGEIYDGTAKWRSENVGPVFRFSPLDPANSHRYNPLSAVRSDPDFLWEDSRFLADMMIVPTNAKDPFWETRARDVLTAAIARACLSDDPAQRSLGSVIDVFHGVGWDAFTRDLQARIDMRSMTRAGTSLAEMDKKTRDGVLQTGLASLSAWDGDRIERTTRSSDWNPLDLRSGQNPTIYICLKSNEVKSYVSILRVMISQHIRSLTASLPPRGSPPILFMLDELPQLRNMPPVEEGLNVGSQYGIRLWMFAQSVGQMKEAYENAEGMIGSCAVQMYMNPSLFDETAQKLSDDIGFQEGVLDAQRQKIVEAPVLAGPDYKDFVIVMASGFKAFRVRKSFAHQDATLRERMGS